MDDLILDFRWDDVVLLTIITLASVVIWWYLAMDPTDAPPEHCDYRVGRKLGLMEHFFYTRCGRGTAYLSNVIIIGSLQPITTSHVTAALTNLMNIHPLLRMYIKHIKNKPWFLPLDDPKPKLIVDSGTSWETVLEDNLVTKFEDNELQWRVTFVPQAEITEVSETHPHHCVLVFTFNHVIIDGISYMRLFNTFMDLLSEVLQNKHVKHSSLPLLPPIESYMNFNKPSAFRRIQQFMWKYLSPIEMLRPYIIKDLVVQEGTNDFVEKFGIERDRDSSLVDKSCIIPHILNEEDTSALIKQCKLHKVTLQSAVQAAASFAVSRLFKELSGEEQDKNVSVLTGLPINLRHRLQYEIDPKHLGCYFLPSLHEVCVPPQPIDSGHLWSVAAEIRDDIQKQIKKKKYMWFYTELCAPRALANITVEELDKGAEQKHKTGGRYPCILLFSNKGNCSYLNRDITSPVKLLARYGGSGEHLDGPIFDNDLVTFEGKLYWTVLYFNQVTLRKTCEMYIKYTMEYVNMMLK